MFLEGGFELHFFVVAEKVAERLCDVTLDFESDILDFECIE